MNLSREQIQLLAIALRGLDGPKDAPYKFSSKVRYSLAKNLRILSKKSEDFDKVRMGIVREISPETYDVAKATPEAKLFTDKWEPFSREEEEVTGLMRFTLGDLNLDINPISIQILSILGPLMIEDVEPAST